MKLLRYVASAIVLTLFGTTVRADFIAYDVTAGLVGNQTNFAGSIGMDFNLNASITITRLGVFDSGGNGLATAKTVYLYDRDTQALLVSAVIPAGTGASLVNGSRFVDIPQITINAAVNPHLTIVTDGFNVNDPNYNTFNTNPSPSTLDTSGFITFVGSGRFGTAGAYPTNVDGRNSVNPYAAATFAFVPEPSSTILVGMGLVGLLGYSSRRRLLAKAQKND